MGLLSRYSNFVPRLINLKPECLQAGNYSMFTQVSHELTDTSYDPNYIISEIRQQQKDLSDDEIRQIAQRYTEGASIYELAHDFGCHRGTISRALKKAGVIVTHKASSKDGVVENVLRLYEEFMTAADIGKEVGIAEKTVLNILRENGVRIRHSSEYERKD